MPSAAVWREFCERREAGANGVGGSGGRQCVCLRRLFEAAAGLSLLLVVGSSEAANCVILGECVALGNRCDYSKTARCESRGPQHRPECTVWEGLKAHYSRLGRNRNGCRWAQAASFKCVGSR